MSDNNNYDVSVLISLGDELLYEDGELFGIDSDVEYIEEELEDEEIRNEVKSRIIQMLNDMSDEEKLDFYNRLLLRVIEVGYYEDGGEGEDAFETLWTDIPEEPEEEMEEGEA